MNPNINLNPQDLIQKPIYNPNYLNLEYFFQKVLDFFNRWAQYLKSGLMLAPHSVQGLVLDGKIGSKVIFEQANINQWRDGMVLKEKLEHAKTLEQMKKWYATYSCLESCKQPQRVEDVV